MRKSALAIGVAASICLAGTAAPAAFAQGHTPHAKAAKPKVTVSPAKPKLTSPVTAKASGFPKNTKIVCLLVVFKPGAPVGAAQAYVPSLVNLKSNAKGKATCHQLFLKFKAKDSKGKTHSCPPSKADKKSGWGCGVTVANPANHKQYAVGLFKF
jgi:hypothetical protein